MVDFVYTARGASIAVSGVDLEGAVVTSLFPTQRAHIEDALNRIPIAHLSAIPPIIVGDRPSSGGGYSAGAIRLNRRTFGARHNARYLFTLVHEVGHAVDRARHAVARFQSQTGETGPEWDAYRAIVYNGHNCFPAGTTDTDRGGHPIAGTPRYGEHFAEGYAHLLCSGRHLTSTQMAIIRRLAGM
jgi:hypothetical protein